jgi:hypothetical protein
MKKFRLSKDTTEHYTSLEELRTAWLLKPVIKKTKDQERLKKQQESFYNKHKCPACSKPMTYLHGNIMTCTNPQCKGIEIKREDNEGNTLISYLTPYDLLDTKGSDIATNILA